MNQSQHSLTSTVRMSSYTSPSPPKMTTGLSQCGGPAILTMQRQFIIFSCRRCDLSGLVPGTGPLCSSGGSSGRTAGRCGAAGSWHSHSTSWGQGRVDTSAVERSIGSTTGCTITEKVSTRAFTLLKTPTSAFTFKTLLSHYAKRALTPRSLNVKLGPRRNYHKGRAAIRHYANQTACPL